MSEHKHDLAYYGKGPEMTVTMITLVKQVNAFQK